MISDLSDTRTELRQLLTSTTVPRTPEPDVEENPPAPAPPGETPSARPWVDLGPDTANPADEQQPTSSDTASQGETVEPTAPQPESGKHRHGQDQSEEAALKSAIEGAYQGAGASAEQPADASPQAVATTESRPQVDHGVRLLTAAGLASAELVVHRDTWEWVSALASGHPHFRTPPTVEAVKDGPEGRVQAVLSGRSLIALLIELWNTRASADAMTVEWAMAATVYTRIARSLSGVAGQGETIRIVLDDGLPTKNVV